MTIVASTNTAGSWAAAFETAGGSPIDLSGYTIEAVILADLNGAAITIGDGGLTTSVGGTGSGTLTWTLADGHGLASGTYYVQTRYHTGDANWKDLHKGQLTVGAKGGLSSHLTIGSYDGSVATDVVVALQGPAGADGADGAAGPGVAAGGTTGQVLSKASNDDYDTEWADPSGVDLSTVVAKAGDTMTGSLTMGDAFQFKWSDVGLGRDSAGVLKVTDGGSGVGTIKVNALRASGNIVYGENTTGNKYIIINMTDFGAFVLGSGMALSWRSALTVNSGGNDVGLGRISAGVLKVTDGTTGHGDLHARSLKSSSFTVATLPSAATLGAGSIVYCSDETGGAIPVFSDGTDWRRVSDRAVAS